MQKVTKQWSQEEKQKLGELVQLHSHNSRVDWVKVSTQLNDRTPTQCKLQYWHVLNKQQQKVNFEWSDNKTQELIMLIHVYGKKWKFLQQNYFPELSNEQLRLKFVQCNKMHKQYHQMFENVENADKLSKKNIKVIQFCLKKIQYLKKKFAEINENKPGLILMDPLELKLFGKITAQNLDGLLKEEQKLTMLQEQIKTREMK
ncbi:Myb-like_DNA-binding domain-containing protein [Hexamita inflata]|uniref:Myb-like DNA-binding domain-containing protein n=1 Tax=Hexamita inflata TaxID=28002 RepID=A0AA86NCY6_9EUKA|nr:Myb-like DNA-binding domain-containing protein [Hexamita inflata]